MKHDLTGKPVSEAEVATDLGFTDVLEMRRWETEMVQKVADLEQKLCTAINERDEFRWHGRRMQIVLEKAETFLASYFDEYPDATARDNLRLAISVVCGKGVDWNHVLKDWLLDRPEPGKP